MLSIATIGSFDGVHTGHQFLLDTLCKEAASRGLQPLVIVIDRDATNRLTTPDEQLALLTHYTLHITHYKLSDIQHLTAVEFLSTLNINSLNVHSLLMGFNHRFGADQLDYQALKSKIINQKSQINIIPCPKGPDVSSSQIRKALLDGNIEAANTMLGYNYTLSGTVVHGKALGRTIGFPTANIQPHPSKLIPKPGVYLAVTRHPSPVTALVNIGHALNNDHLTIEAYLPNYDGPEFYGTTLSLELTHRLRDEQHFDSLADLQAQIQQDLKRANLV